MKTCAACGVEKELTQFWAMTRAADGLQYECKDCQRAKRGVAVRAWRKRHPDRYRNLALQRRYGLTVADVALMEQNQEGVCAICGTEFTTECKPVVDHDHETDLVRGLLCKPCNFGLGTFRDDPGALRAAADYLERD